jgi:hypothetical protein
MSGVPRLKARSYVTTAARPHTLYRTLIHRHLRDDHETVREPRPTKLPAPPGSGLLAPSLLFPPFTFHRFYRMRVWWDSHNRLTRWLLAGLLGSFGACSRPSVPCTNVVSSEEVSPSGKFKAVVFHRSCQEWVGSTVTTNVSILPVNQSPGDGNGNVMSYKGEVGVRAGWLSEQRLAIYSFADLNDATRLDTVGGVTIQYPHMVDADIVRPAPPTPSVSATATPAAEGAK